MYDVTIMVREDGDLLFVFAKTFFELAFGAVAKLEIYRQQSDPSGQKGNQLDDRAWPRRRHDHANDLVISARSRLERSTALGLRAVTM